MKHKRQNTVHFWRETMSRKEAFLIILHYKYVNLKLNYDRNSYKICQETYACLAADAVALWQREGCKME